MDEQHRKKTRPNGQGDSGPESGDETPDSAGSTEDREEPNSEGGPSVVEDSASPGGRLEDITQAMVLSGDRPPSNLFIVPHDQLVLFPELVAPAALKSDLARKTVEQAKAQTEYLGLVLLAEGGDPENTTIQDVQPVGCAVRILRTLTLPDGTESVVVRGLRRFKIVKFLRTRPYLIARVEYPEETRGQTEESHAMTRLLRGLLRKILASDESVPDEFKLAAANVEAPRALADFAATWFVRDAKARQEVLAEFDVQDRLEKLITILTREVGLLELGQRIQEQIRRRLEEQQRDFFLREQLKEIKKELGEARDEKEVALERLEGRLREQTLPDEVAARVSEELDRLRLLPIESPESGVIRNYLDWIAALPWSVSTVDRRDLPAAEEVLRVSHFGLEEIKDRILEFLAVRQLKTDHQGPILCFAGPPGVGKTSLGRAIADSLGRKFVRVSLGGMRDEAEIRGHRRTYIGASPGRILQALKQAGSNNPVFMLDEIDKLGQDFRGDPSSALLEALDPEQNREFSDHYLELPFDLSKVLFVATANNLSAIPAPLYDRLEVIELAGYTTNEKVGIARKFLVPRQLERHGLRSTQLAFPVATLRELVHGYTREAGVRQLERQIARVCRKVATRIARRGRRGAKVTVDAKRLVEFLGNPTFTADKAQRPRRPGMVTGLSWTPVGGQALSIEAAIIPGSGQLILTGMLGDVMLESARIALSHVRGHADAYGFEPIDLKQHDLHLHVPAGAVPKDGPSAGVTMATAIVSLLRGAPIRAGLAMTGELTLTGRVLPVGGLRNKVLAARRAGIKDVLVPSANQRDIEELTDEARSGLRFHYAEEFAEVVTLAFNASASRSLARAGARPRRATGKKTAPKKRPSRRSDAARMIHPSDLKEDAS